MIKMFNEIKEFKDNNLRQSHPGDVGWDIRSGEDGYIPPRCSSKFIYTGLHLCLPFFLCGNVQARSGQLKQDVTAEGIIDSGYRGAIGIKLFNHHWAEPYRFKKGNRIAQLKFEIAPQGLVKFMQKWGEYAFQDFKVTESESMDDWPVSSRGSDGFGSTGVI